MIRPYVFQNKDYRRAILGTGRGVRVATKLRKNTYIMIIQSYNQSIAIWQKNNKINLHFYVCMYGYDPRSCLEDLTINL